MAQNRAAWLISEKANPLRVDDAPVPTVEKGTVLIKNYAAAVNPIDWKIQNFEYSAYVKNYPFILGCDVAGTVEAVGEGVTNLKKGDRVIAHVPGLLTGNPAHNGFQLFPLAYEIMTSPIPDSLSYEQAVVLPLAISTAAAGLYQHDYLNLPLPPSTTKQNNNKTVLIWGGSSSVGATAVQLATASGLRVITTASSSNFEFVRSLGAAAVFDYKSASVVEDIVSEIKKGGSEFVGVYDAIGEVEKSVAPLAGVLKQLGKLDMQVSSVLPCDKNPYGLKSKFVFALTLATPPYEPTGHAIWRDYVPAALATGQLQAKPDPLVVGSGLDDVQKALDAQMAGVSAKKVVVNFSW